ncbi:hypothetical protein [Sorangium cellulosum]|uniref:Uncharacterized protein n=1 Tax=Sorangium cellulosum So0157-2 TaxID=1254432 RepID=S4Y448_SORCE|nr:hypothetical protein [Sorangium cellulosum]AGP37698.1 hypothetical protein SCE1572_26405 [Sorangium cellulosum So0157-2]
MSFDDLKKKHMARIEQQRRSSKAADLTQEEYDRFEAALPALTAEVLGPEFEEAERTLNEMELDARLAKDAFITNLAGTAHVRVSGTSKCLFDLSFVLPPPKDKQKPHYDLRVSVLAIVPPGKAVLEIHATNTEIGAKADMYTKRASLALQDISRTRVHEELFQTMDALLED